VDVAHDHRIGRVPECAPKPLEQVRDALDVDGTTVAEQKKVRARGYLVALGWHSGGVPGAAGG